MKILGLLLVMGVGIFLIWFFEEIFKDSSEEDYEDYAYEAHRKAVRTGARAVRREARAVRPMAYSAYPANRAVHPAARRAHDAVRTVRPPVYAQSVSSDTKRYEEYRSSCRKSA